MALHQASTTAPKITVLGPGEPDPIQDQHRDGQDSFYPGATYPGATFSPDAFEAALNEAVGSHAKFTGFTGAGFTGRFGKKAAHTPIRQNPNVGQSVGEAFQEWGALAYKNRFLMTVPIAFFFLVLFQGNLKIAGASSDLRDVRGHSLVSASEALAGLALTSSCLLGACLIGRKSNGESE